jgi:hypothetical protein
VWTCRPHRRSFVVSPTTEVRTNFSLYVTFASTPTGNPTGMTSLVEGVSLVGFASPAFARVCPYQRAIRVFLFHVKRQFYASVSIYTSAKAFGSVSSSLLVHANRYSVSRSATENRGHFIPNSRRIVVSTTWSIALHICRVFAEGITLPRAASQGSEFGLHFLVTGQQRE